MLQAPRCKKSFLTLLKVINEYADEALVDKKSASVSVFEILFMFLDTIVEIGCLQPLDFAVYSEIIEDGDEKVPNVFQTIDKGLQVYGNSQVQMRLQYVASIFITLLSKNSHLVE